LGDILFNHYSVFDEPDKYIKVKDIPKIYLNETRYKIALFHGPVNNAITDVGYKVASRTITNEIFDGHDIVLLGDIHRHQVLSQSNPIIVYCGSLIQQNHGEDLKGHGFVFWDLKTKVFKHFEIPNDYGFYTAEINKGNLITDISNVPYQNPTYSSINAPGRYWVFEYTLALAAESLAFIRGKYGSVPIPGAEVSLNQADLLTKSRDLQTALIEKLRLDLDESSRRSQLQRKAEENDFMQKTLGQVPLNIFIG
jgi:DNA repair exonuclease SbcCD nuclease subunit